VGDHPVKVPPELFTEWLSEALLQHDAKSGTIAAMVADRAAQWAWDQREPELQERADQELEACIKWFDAHIPGYEMVADRLRAARRAMPPSLAEQGMEALSKGCFPSDDEIATIRTALDRLAELEAQQ
jgi:hypothetical protein